jgi:hypothetical protein
MHPEKYLSGSENNCVLRRLLRMSTGKGASNVVKERSITNQNHEVGFHWHIAMGVLA